MNSVQTAMFPVLHRAGQCRRHRKRKFDNQRDGASIERQGYNAAYPC